MMVTTGPLNSVTLHDDGRVSLIRAMRREGVFLHIELTDRELEALSIVLDQRSRTR